MKNEHYPFYPILIIFALLLSTQFAKADWRDNMENLIYSPRYFGPTAFPFPELRSGLSPTRYEVELRGQYHHYSGDKTKDLYARVLLPIFKGKAGVEVSCIIVEDYKLTPETRDERYAVETESPISYNGDIVVSAFFQILKSKKWMDVLASMTLKTASGSRVCDARYTDAAAYWFDVNVGRDLWKNQSGTATLRAQALVGFYCWMTNNIVHRQNDAISYGGGLTGTYRNFTLSTDLTGFHGYENNGDRPLILRNNLRYEFKKNIVSFRYNHGMKDYLYDNFSLGYIRCF